MSTITNESEEMYLESIYVLSKSGEVRSIDVANKLGYAKSSVTVGMKNLLDKGYIEYNDNKSLKLTDKGIKEALRVYERHLVLEALLVHLGANEEMAEENGCKIEHVISDELLDVLKGYLDKNNIKYN